MEIDNRVKDHLSMALNEDWKRFGMEILHDNDIKRIDMDHRSVYEKCFEMLNQWEKKSEVPVNIGMVMQVLLKLRRNDIWSSLQESKCF